MNNDWFAGLLPSPEYAGVFNGDSPAPWWHYQSNGDIYKYGVSGELFGEIEPGIYPHSRYVAYFFMYEGGTVGCQFDDIDAAKEWIEWSYGMRYEQ